MPAPGVWQIDVIDTSTLKVISTIKNGHAWIPILRERKENITIEAALALCMKFKRALNPPPAAVIEDLVPARSAAANAVSTDVASQPLAGDDLNGDGALDLVTAGSVNTVTVFLTRPGGSRQFSASYTIGRGPESLILVDLNGDQQLDLVVATYGDTTDPGGVAILLGNGGGTFRPAVTHRAGRGPRSVAAADFNGDGRVDIAVANGGGTPSGDVSILLGTGDGGFRAAVQYAAGVNPTSVLAGDFNADQKLDLVVANQGSSNVSTMLGNGDGTFRLAMQTAVSGQPEYLGCGDFNRDGRADLLVSTPFQDSLSVWLGNGAGGFSPGPRYTGGRGNPYFILEDVDDDGMPDILTGTPYQVLIYAGNPDGFFFAPRNHLVGPNPAAMAIADFNGDGKPDIAATADRSISMLTGKGGVEFDPVVSLPQTSTFNAITAGDFNRDGRADLAVTGGNQLQVLSGNGNGTFGAAATFPVGPSPSSVIAAEFNGDGRPDLAVVYEGSGAASGGVSILLATATGFQTSVNLPTGQRAAAIVTGDFNGDNRPDLAAINKGNFPAASSLSILIGNGDGTFRPAVNRDAGFQATHVASGDLNGDGRTDLVVAGQGSSTGSFQLLVLLGNGDGTFQSPRTFRTDDGPARVVPTDLNRDGKQDLVVAHCCGSVDMTYLLGNGDGSFQPDSHFPGGADPVAVGLADFNGDRIPDLAILNSTQSRSITVAGTVTVLLNAFPDALHVSAASFEFGPVAPDSIVAGFGPGLASRVVAADSVPLPAALDGTTVTVEDSSGGTRAAPLFFVSPGQVNYLMPPDLSLGAALITISPRSGPPKVSGTLLTKTAAGIFVLNTELLAAAQVLRVNGSGEQSVEPVFQVDPATGRLDAAPIDLGPATDQVYLLLYGTGLRANSGLVRATVGNVVTPVSYAGAQGGFPGLDQVNLLLPRSLAGRGMVDIILTVDDTPANRVRVRIR